MDEDEQMLLDAGLAGLPEGEEDLEDAEINQEDAWAVITSYFQEKGLVRQQLDSFNEFANNTMQEIVEECSEVVVEAQSQHRPDQARAGASFACGLPLSAVN